MNKNAIPRVLEPRAVAALIPHQDLLIVDVGGRRSWLQGHLRDAVYIDYSQLSRGSQPAPGLLPPIEQIQKALEAIGFTPDKHVVAYDDQANARASRLLWTLEAVGHSNSSLLSGGIDGWQNEGYGLVRGPEWGEIKTSKLSLKWNQSVIADKEYVRNALGNPQIVLLDARSALEYHGKKSPSRRNGRIPGAVHLDWLDTIDAERDFRYLPDAQLNAMLAELGIDRDKEIITYCQTHQRSSHSFMLLRHLGFEKVRGYAGAWAEWGNDLELPIE